MQRRPFTLITTLVPALALVLAVLASAAPPEDPLGGAGTPFGTPGFGSPGGSAMPPPIFGDSRDAVEISLRVDRKQAARGADIAIAVVFDHFRGWHTWTNARELSDEFEQFDGAIHTEITFSTSVEDALVIHDGFLTWPEPHASQADIGYGPATYAVFSDRALGYLPVTVAADAPLGPVTLTAIVTFQSCNDSVCMAPAMGVPLEVTFDIVDAGTAAPAEGGSDFAAFPGEIWASIHAGETPPSAGPKDSVVAIDIFGIVSFDVDAAGAGLILLCLVAAIGGLLLNFTPCVLPVVPLKIMGLSQSAAHRGQMVLLGTAMSLGVVAFWVGLGVAISLVSGFTSTNQLFQYPAFNISVGVIIAVMAIGMCGLFAVRLPQFVYSINPGHDTLPGSFGFGIMTAVLSTPCTAPMMGAAAAWAAGQQATIVLTVFASIGAGMALPYQLLSMFPGLLKKMPRTGPASELIKHVMGLLMLAAAAFFVGSGLSSALVAPPEPPSRLYWWFVAAFGIAAGGWLAYRTFRITPNVVRRIGFGGLGACILAISVWIGSSQTAHGPINWVYFTPERFAEAKADGHIVVMEFTAEWCLNCKALETAVLHSDSVANLLAEDDIVPIKVDISGRNAVGNAMLNEAGRVTIPLLVVYRPDGTEVFKSDSYTRQQVLDAVAEARTGTIASR